MKHHTEKFINSLSDIYCEKRKSVLQSIQLWSTIGGLGLPLHSSHDLVSVRSGGWIESLLVALPFLGSLPLIGHLIDQLLIRKRKIYFEDSMYPDLDNDLKLDFGQNF